MKLKRINDTTYEADFGRARVEIGDINTDKFIPSCKMFNFEDETSLKVSYADRPYSLVTPEAEEVDKIVLTEAVYYPSYEIGVWYDAGDLLKYNGGLFEVVQGHTSQEDWPPPEVPALYKVSTPQGVIAEWVQPLGAHDAYAVDAKVYHNDKVWKSIIDANVWEPGVYGWEETDGRVDVECYCIDGIGEQNVSGFEFEIVLRERPVSNVVEMAIESEGLNFYYQPELTQQEIDEGAYRPENVVGSYAVYHATCGQMHKEQANAQKYQTGKAFHIYRPKVVDVNNNWIWGGLSIDVEAGMLSITVDEQWLNSAVYPVKVDPTFGYVDENGDGIVGGSIAPLGSTGNTRVGSYYTCPETGEIESLSFYFSTLEGGEGKAAIYSRGVDLDNSNLIQQTNELIDIPEQLNFWLAFPFNNHVAVSLDSDYYFIITAVNAQIKFDTVAALAARHWGVDYSELFSATLALFEARDWLVSSYATYGIYEIPVPVLAAAQENGNIRVSWTYSS